MHEACPVNWVRMASRSWSPLRLTSDERIPRLLGFFLLAAYAAGTLYAGLHHEPWRDEADVWLAARDMTVTDAIPRWTAHEGSPGLWFLLLKTLTALNLPYVSMTLLHVALAWAAAAVLIFAAPFTRLTKLLLLSSYFLAYEYAVIARSYVLTVLLLFIAASAFRRSAFVFAIAVALLFNTNVHGALIAAVLLLVSVVSSDRRVAPIAVMAAGGLLAFLQLRGGSGNPDAMRLRPYAVPFSLSDAFLPGAPTLWAAVAGLAVIVSVAIAIRGRRDALLLLLACAIGLIAVYAFVWFGGLRHSGLVLIVVIASIWIAADVPDTSASRIAAVLLNVTLAASAIYTFVNARADVRYAFSGSKEAAEFIDHRFDDYAIAAHNMYFAESILPYLPGRRFWYAGLGEYGTYMKWDEKQGVGVHMPYEVAAQRARQQFRGTKWLLLVNDPMPDPERHGFRLVHAPEVVVFRHPDERFWLYAPL